MKKQQYIPVYEAIPPYKAAKLGERMIEVHVRFWTNAISPFEGEVLPKHAWDSGVMTVQSNGVHGIKSAKPQPFHSFNDVASVMAKVLTQHGIRLHPSRKSKKLIQA